MGRKAILIIGFLIVGFALLYWFGLRQSFEESPPSVGSIAPEINLADIAGNMISLHELKGKVIILTFWASWCPICTSQLKWYEKIYEQLQRKGLFVLAIATDDVDVEDIKKLGLTFPVLKVIKRVKEVYHVNDVPATFVIDKRGVIVKKVKRYFDKKEFIKHLNRLLNE